MQSSSERVFRSDYFSHDVGDLVSAATHIICGLFNDVSQIILYYTSVLFIQYVWF